jgi:hypothetical protein
MSSPNWQKYSAGVVTNTAGDVAVQKVLRIAAGDAVQSVTAPNDVSTRK